ncbi:MAG: ribonuclease HII [Alphaproteobacteria bacterium HGW-Alphaproteobacteria-12]|nr:MAG: ribonuclease HII [Alphaproteobacteria bacterium HGW-Alphaproteobacteria-12]
MPPAPKKPAPTKSLRALPDFAIEIEEGAPARIVCGVDEAGRGPLAGPVVAAAVIIDPSRCPEGLNDSKQLTPARRAALLAELEAHAEIGVGLASVAEIDALNILHATMLAMTRAIAALAHTPHVALIDGNRCPPGLGCASRAVIGGDGLARSIAAASIVAKVTRDRLMADLAAAYPGYGFERHMGYGTRAHLDALSRLGATPIHRRSFAPVRKILSPDPAGGLDMV